MWIYKIYILIIILVCIIGLFDIDKYMLSILNIWLTFAQTNIMHLLRYELHDTKHYIFAILFAPIYTLHILFT